MIRINPGDPQPMPCKNCGDIQRHQHSDHIVVYYTCVHDSDGEWCYSDDERALNSVMAAYCCNCGDRLNFSVETRVIHE